MSKFTAFAFLVALFPLSMNARASSVQLSNTAAQEVALLLRDANLAGDTAVQFIGGSAVSEYLVGDLNCYFQNSDGSASCSTPSELSGATASELGALLRKAELAGDSKIQFIGGPSVTEYSVGNLYCYLQNSDDDVTCSVGN